MDEPSGQCVLLLAPSISSNNLGIPVELVADHKDGVACWGPYLEVRDHLRRGGSCLVHGYSTSSKRAPFSELLHHRNVAQVVLDITRVYSISVRKYSTNEGPIGIGRCGVPEIRRAKATNDRVLDNPLSGLIYLQLPLCDGAFSRGIIASHLRKVIWCWYAQRIAVYS